jgi:hypothetical protein
MLEDPAYSAAVIKMQPHSPYAPLSDDVDLLASENNTELVRFVEWYGQLSALEVKSLPAGPRNAARNLVRQRGAKTHPTPAGKCQRIAKEIRDHLDASSCFIAMDHSGSSDDSDASTAKPTTTNTSVSVKLDKMFEVVLGGLASIETLVTKICLMDEKLDQVLDGHAKLEARIDLATAGLALLADDHIDLMATTYSKPDSTELDSNSEVLDLTSMWKPVLEAEEEKTKLEAEEKVKSEAEVKAKLEA